jgi:hypothetical protein
VFLLQHGTVLPAKINIMKYLAVICTISFITLFVRKNSNAQIPSRVYTYTSVAFPSSNLLQTSFYVNDANKVFIPLNGGIYMPQDSIWFIPPSKRYIFTSVAIDLKDTGLFVAACSADSSHLFYLKSSTNSPIKRSRLAELTKGIYNLILRNNICYIWGYSGDTSKVGILTDNGVEWLMHFTGVIQQVQVNDRFEIFFSVGNSIYQLNNNTTVLKLTKKIYGFCFDENDKLVVSTDDGVAIVDKGVQLIIAKNVLGIMQQQDEKVYILSNKEHKLYILSKM